MLYNAREFFVRLSDGTVTVLAFGKGKRPLVLIPGLRLSDIRGGAYLVAWYYRMFAQDYSVYMIDKKDPVTDGCTVHDLAEDTAAVMEKLGITEACVFGASLGGMIAQDLAIHHPALVSALVLGVTASRPNAAIRQAIDRWTALAGTSGLSAVAEDYVRSAYSEGYLRKYGALLPLALRLQKQMPADRFLTLAHACLTCGTYESLNRIHCPVLVLGGEKDRIVTGEASREIAEKLGCACRMYEELGHEAYNEAKDFNQRIYDFCRDHSR